MDEHLVRRRRAIERERARFLVDPAGAAIDGAVRDSWLRCAPALAESQAAAPLDEADTATDRWEASPIRRAFPGLTEQLRRAADDGDLVAGISDEAGRIMWMCGGRTMRNRAESVNFAIGGRWDERSVGTNAVGLALITGSPTTVFAGEHWCAAVDDWVCYSAPVRDTHGRLLGVIDLSSTWDRASPLGLTTVSALAQVVEHALRMPAGSAAPGPRATGDTRLGLRVLGRGTATLDGAPVVLSLRQLEILTVLACIGQATLGELHGLLHGDRAVSPTTTKSEVSRLRRTLGDVIASRPYELTVPVEIDLLDVIDLVDAGEVGAAARLYGGQLLARSDAPYIVERRYHCDVALRTALLRAGTTRDLLAFADVHPFDVEVLERALARAGSDDPHVATATARLAVALAD
jgi:GAF domain-containing protein